MLSSRALVFMTSFLLSLSHPPHSKNGPTDQRALQPRRRPAVGPTPVRRQGLWHPAGRAEGECQHVVIVSSTVQTTLCTRCARAHISRDTRDRCACVVRPHGEVLHVERRRRRWQLHWQWQPVITSPLRGCAQSMPHSPTRIPHANAQSISAHVQLKRSALCWRRRTQMSHYLPNLADVPVRACVLASFCRAQKPHDAKRTRGTNITHTRRRALVIH